MSERCGVLYGSACRLYGGTMLFFDDDDGVVRWGQRIRGRWVVVDLDRAWRTGEQSWNWE